MLSQETNTSIVITFFVTATISIIGTLYAKSILGRGTTSYSIASICTDTVSYLPHILLLFGVIADMLTYQGVYSIASLIGLFSIPLNFIFKFFWSGIMDTINNVSNVVTGSNSSLPSIPSISLPSIPSISLPSIPSVISGNTSSSTARTTTGNTSSSTARTTTGNTSSSSSTARTTTGNTTNPAAGTGLLTMPGGARGDFFKDYNGCEVQGFESLRNPYAPQTLVVTATIFFYYLLDLIINRGWVNSSATFVLFSVLYIAQVMIVGDCNEAGENISKTIKAFISLIEGLFIGGVSYAVVQAYHPTRLPSSVISPFPRKSRSDLKEGTGGSLIDDSGNPYVCLQNGQCYPDMSSNESRKAFAEIASKNLGTGSPPAASCSS